MNQDLTVIFLTVNKVPEYWRQYHRGILLKAIGHYPLITISRKKMPDMPGINLIQTEETCSSNVYKQMLRGAKEAKTPYIAIAEDDSLYPACHFHDFRPPTDTFAYNMHRWSVYVWRKDQVYGWRDRISNLTTIAPRELTIRCLEERFKKFPDGTPEDKTGEMGRPNVERMLGLPKYPSVMWNSSYAVINFNHDYSMDDMEHRHVKKPGALRAYDIPYWGHVSTLVQHFR